MKFAKANFYSPEKILVFAFLVVHRPYKWNPGTLDEYQRPWIPITGTVAQFCRP